MSKALDLGMESVGVLLFFAFDPILKLAQRTQKERQQLTLNHGANEGIKPALPN